MTSGGETWHYNDDGDTFVELPEIGLGGGGNGGAGGASGGGGGGFVGVSSGGSGGFERLPDFYTLNLSVAIPNPYTLTLIGWNGTISIDRHLQIFGSPFGLTVGKSTTLFAGSITANTLQQPTTPSAVEMANFLSGHGVSISAGFIYGHNFSYSPTNNGTKSAFGIGFFTPQIGASYNYTPNYLTITKK